MERYMLLFLVWTSIGISSQIAITKDGREVLLNDDGTWQYVPPKVDTMDYYHVRIAPRPIEIPEIPYPEEARKEAMEGKTIVRALVDIDGKVITVEVEESSGFNTLDSAALEAIEKATFEPARHDGNLVKVWVTIPAQFLLQEEKSEKMKENE